MTYRARSDFFSKILTYLGFQMLPSAQQPKGRCFSALTQCGTAKPCPGLHQLTPARIIGPESVNFPISAGGGGVGTSNIVPLSDCAALCGVGWSVWLRKAVWGSVWLCLAVCGFLCSVWLCIAVCGMTASKPLLPGISTWPCTWSLARGYPWPVCGGSKTGAGACSQRGPSFTRRHPCS